jgi:hypothetical protein
MRGRGGGILLGWRKGRSDGLEPIVEVDKEV